MNYKNNKRLMTKGERPKIFLMNILKQKKRRHLIKRRLLYVFIKNFSVFQIFRFSILLINLLPVLIFSFLPWSVVIYVRSNQRDDCCTFCVNHLLELVTYLAP